MTFEIEVGDGLLTFILRLRSCGFWVYLDYNISSGPSLSFEIEIGDRPGPKLDNFFFLITLEPFNCYSQAFK